MKNFPIAIGGWHPIAMKTKNTDKNEKTGDEKKSKTKLHEPINDGGINYKARKIKTISSWLHTH